jgi:hypothetical protein
MLSKIRGFLLMLSALLNAVKTSMKVISCSYECDVKKFPEIHSLGGSAMKKSLIYTIVGFVTAMCLPIWPASADDQLITVPDAGFDDHVLNNVGDWIYIGDGSYKGAWKNLFTGSGAWIDYGYYGDDPDGPDLPALSGNNKVYATYPADTEDYIYQILDEKFVEGETYTLRTYPNNP